MRPQRYPRKPNPEAIIVKPDGSFTQEGFNLISEMLERLDALSALPAYTTTEIGDEEAQVNLAGKKQGKVILDATTHKIMVARGGGVNDPWDVADASGSVTPS